MANGYQEPRGHPLPHGYPAPNGYPVPGAYQEPTGYPVPDGYPAPGGYPRESYPRENGYPGAHESGYGETVNGGYTSVIRQDEAFGPGAPRPVPPGRAPAPDRQPAVDQRLPRDPRPRAEPPRPDPLAGSDPSTFVYRDVGGADEPDEPEPAEPGVPYGPDDPAYGPPSPDWYAREDREDDEEARQQAVAGQLRYARGPFEPLPHSGADVSHADSYQGTGFEPPGAGDGPGGAGDRTLEQIKDLYMTAEAIGAKNLDKHFEQLLERQRQLISEYFTEADAGDRRAATGLEDLNGTGGGRGRLAFGSDQRSPR